MVSNTYTKVLLELLLSACSSKARNCLISVDFPTPAAPRTPTLWEHKNNSWLVMMSNSNPKSPNYINKTKRQTQQFVTASSSTHPLRISLTFSLLHPFQAVSFFCWILRIPHVKTKTFGQRFLFYCAPKQWNSHPSDIRHFQSSHAFKTALKANLYKQYHNEWSQECVLVCVC